MTRGSGADGGAGGGMRAGAVATIGFADAFIASIAERLAGEAAARDGDLSRIAVVFGGRRPALFLARDLGARLGRGFFPPRCFTMDGFMEHSLRALSPRRPIPALDAWHIIYRLTRDFAPGMLEGRRAFSRFAVWAREIAAFIDELDIEDVAPETLAAVQEGAALGLDAARGVADLIEKISAIRDGYHRALAERRAASRGLTYLLVSRGIGGLAFDEFDRILFCGLFSLHRTEERVVSELYRRGAADLYFQRGDEAWPSLDRLSKAIGAPIPPPGGGAGREPEIALWAGNDTQTQVGIVRGIVAGIPDRSETVIVLPDPGGVIPLVSEISSVEPEFNVSMGYPLRRSALCNLLGCVFDAQKGMRGGAYYSRDYLRVLTHPLVKNMSVVRDGALTRVLVHKIEEALRGTGGSPLEGSRFVRAEEVEAMEGVFSAAAAALREMGIDARPGELAGALSRLHACVFRPWEGIGNFREFAAALESFVDACVRMSALERYPLNLTFAGRLLSMASGLGGAEAGGERFEKEEMFKLFSRLLEREQISFSGSPLRGLQVLGLMETRSLDFKNVIVMDVNESVLPSLRGPDPLVPRQVRVALGLDRAEQEEEIQRYHFTRLVRHAERVHLVYRDREDQDERSRFIEELVWRAQRSNGSLDAAPVRRARVALRLSADESPVEKSDEVLRFLDGFRHSPTSVDAYLRCPLRFYYGHVMRLREAEDLLEEPGGAEIGRFVHRLLYESFAPFIGGRPLIDARFRKRFFKRLKSLFDEIFGKRMRSDAFILEDVLKVRLGRFLDAEGKRPLAEIVALEEGFAGALDVAGGVFQFTCRIDRLDREEGGGLLVIDYKTGAAQAPAGPDALDAMDMTRDSILRAVRSFQLPIYRRFVSERFPDAKVRAAVYDLREPAMLDFPRGGKRPDEASARCDEALAFILREITDPAVPFTRSPGRGCEWCPFKLLCR